MATGPDDHVLDPSAAAPRPDPGALLDEIFDLVAVIDPLGRVRYANEAVFAVMGWDRDLVGSDRSLFDFVHPEDQEVALAKLTHVVVGDKDPHAQHVRVCRGDGRWIWLELMVRECLEDPAIGGLVLSARDMTQHVAFDRAVQERLASEDLVARAAARFVDVGADGIDAAVVALLADLGELVGADRVWTAVITPDGGSVRRSHTWVRPGAVPLPAPVGAVLDDVPALQRFLDHPGSLRLDTVERIETGGRERVALDARAVRALLAEPITVQDERRGLLVLEAETDRPGWDGETQRLVSTIGGLIGLAVRRATAEGELAGNEARLRALLQHAAEGVRLLDADLRVRWAGPAAGSVVARTVTGAVDHAAWCRLVHPDDVATASAALADCASRPRTTRRVAYRLRAPDGSWRHVEELATNLLDDPVVGGIVVNTRDVTERFAHERELHTQARRDPLTGLPNRRLFEELLDGALARAERAGTGCAVIFIDLDRFKLVNDSLGHHVGDALLIEAAERLRQAVRTGDLSARLSGDEFVVLCEGVRGLEEANEVASRIVDAFRAPFLVADRELSATASVGVAMAGPGVDRNALLRDADVAMYAAKEAGRNRQAVFSGALVLAARRRLDLEVALRRALVDDELEMWWQPVVDLATGRPVAVEALLRWRSSNGRVHAPLSFLDVAEDTGLLVPMGTWAIEQACASWAALADETGRAGLALHVNVSTAQVIAGGLAETADGARRAAGLADGTLHLEIVERALLSGEAALAELADVRARGIGLVLDQFGSDQSSPRMVRDLRVDTVKIDRSYIAEIDGDADDTAVAAAMVQLARALGAGVIAIGVETDDQVERLRDLGCGRAQGYRFCPPVDDDGLRAWMADAPR